MDGQLDVRLPVEYKPDQLEEFLADKYAFLVEPSVAESWTYYDTFDWGLCNRSLLLRQSGQELVMQSLKDDYLLSGPIGTSSPKFAWDLPESVLRNRLERIIKLRALLPLTQIDTWSQIYRVLNADEKTVARLVYTETRPVGEGEEPGLVSYLSLRPVRGYPKYARMLAKKLRRAGKKVSMTEDVYLRALDQVGKKPCSYSGKLNLRLKPRKRSDSSTKTILRRLLEIMEANEDGIKADIDTEFLHDYRIAIRRTRSALSQIRNVFPAKDTEHFKNSFRTIGQRTNALRDLDVYLLSEAEFEARLPVAMGDDIVPLFDYLRDLRESELERVIEGLSSSEYAMSIEQWRVFLNEPVPKKPKAANAAMPIVELARKRIYKRYQRVIKDGDYILTHTKDEHLHALRIECKKLRYLMEFFSSLFPGKKIAKLIKQLKKLQDNLGEFNDLSVQQEYLMHIAEELPMDGRGSRKALVATGYLVENMGYKQKTVKANFAHTFKEFASPANQKMFHRLFAAKGKKGGK